jgi:hypothetical protein
MIKEKVLIHVGLHKTASTYLQQKVFPAISQFLFLGKSYLGNNSAFNRLVYADDSLYQSSLVREEMRLVQERMTASGVSGLILSEEEFNGHPEYNYLNRGQIARRLAETFPHAEILLVLRGQVSLIASLYNQFVKTGQYLGALDRSFLHSPGEGMSLAEWFAEPKHHAGYHDRFINHQSLLIPDHFRYTSLHGFYASLFPKVHVLLFEELKATPNVFLDRLAAILSTPLPDSIVIHQKDPPLVNEGVSSRQLNARRLYHGLSRLGLPLRKGRSVEKALKLLTYLEPDRCAEGRDYVVRLCRARGLEADNQQLNDHLTLGMSRFPESYINFT